jgi:predicted TIM-barrel enzyme
MQFTRKDVLARLRETLREGHPIIAAGAGIGLSAKFAERGGAQSTIPGSRCRRTRRVSDFNQLTATLALVVEAETDGASSSAPIWAIRRPKQNATDRG